MPDIVPSPQVGDPITARWAGIVASTINACTPQLGRGQTPSGRVGDPSSPDFSARARVRPYEITVTPNGDSTAESPGTLSTILHSPSMDSSGIYNPYNLDLANRPIGGKYVLIADDVPADADGGLEIWLRVRYVENVYWYVARVGGKSYAKVYSLSGDIDTADDSILLYSSVLGKTDREYTPQVSAPIMMPRPATNPDIDDLYHVAEKPATYFYGGTLQRNALTSAGRLATDDASVSVSTTVSNGSVSWAGYWDAYSTLEGTGITIDTGILADFSSKIGSDYGVFGGMAFPVVCFTSEGDYAVPGSRRDLHYLSLYHFSRWLRDKILQWAKEYTDEQVASAKNELYEALSSYVVRIDEDIDEIRNDVLELKDYTDKKVSDAEKSINERISGEVSRLDQRIDEALG
ncbi:MAG: hypothetical protein ACI4QT_07075 [Kiritimatiellia bacterium]